MDFKISSPGKLLISSEYCVLKCAQAFAIPTKFTQHLNFKYKGSNNLTWKSFDCDNSLWFECEFEIEKFNICLLYTSPSPRDYAASRMPSSA